MASIVKQDDGTWDVVGLSRDELDVLTTFYGSCKPNLPSALDETCYNLYVAMREDGTYHPEWIDNGKEKAK